MGAAVVGSVVDSVAPVVVVAAIVEVVTGGVATARGPSPLVRLTASAPTTSAPARPTPTSQPRRRAAGAASVPSPGGRSADPRPTSSPSMSSSHDSNSSVATAVDRPQAGQKAAPRGRGAPQAGQGAARAITTDGTPLAPVRFRQAAIP